MINGKKVLAIIPARGDSKGVPKKNIKNLGGKPLIAWTIDEAKKSEYIDRLILSSDCEEIISIAKQFDCEAPFVRPKELALDTTSGMEPVLHAMSIVTGYDIILLLQPTSPLRVAADIDGCLEQMQNLKSPSIVSVKEAEESPYWMFTISSENKLASILPSNGAVRRQDLPRVFLLNGAIYIAESNWLLEKKSFLSDETSAYIMPTIRSLDIDNEIDFKIAQDFLVSENIDV